MAKHQRDSLLSKPVPSAKVPWFIILCLIAALVLVYMGFLRPANKLLGPPIQPNRYQVYMKPAPLLRVPAPVTPAAPPVAPPVGRHPSPSAPATDSTPTD